MLKRQLRLNRREDDMTWHDVTWRDPAGRTALYHAASLLQQSVRIPNLPVLKPFVGFLWNCIFERHIYENNISKRYQKGNSEELPVAPYSEIKMDLHISWNKPQVKNLPKKGTEINYVNNLWHVYFLTVNLIPTLQNQNYTQV
jgi:hypothetical protein